MKLRSSPAASIFISDVPNLYNGLMLASTIASTACTRHNLCGSFRHSGVHFKKFCASHRCLMFLSSTLSINWKGQDDEGDVGSCKY